MNEFFKSIEVSKATTDIPLRDLPIGAPFRVKDKPGVLFVKTFTPLNRTNIDVIKLGVLGVKSHVTFYDTLMVTPVVLTISYEDKVDEND